MASEYPCLLCERNVNDDDRAISCDQCEKWQHLSCDTGISLRQYRKMMKGAVVEWKCRECSRPAEVVPEVQMETADIAEESELTAEVPPEVPMETADIAVDSELAVPEISEIQDTSYMSELYYSIYRI
ncbi:hypothetical protein DPMN_002237 [Dreissena polymorpha]|uniref:PHD-type domain-containing protein n=1 Tax=Dreissena polymorpha TaxID=45954 RepID=A0A9D4MMF9_DREPO|nr:hypothetical protein DPMN_002237 [Dreissena polymorpha]